MKKNLLKEKIKWIINISISKIKNPNPLELNNWRFKFINKTIIYKSLKNNTKL